VVTTDHRWANRECFAVLVALILWGAQWHEAELLLHCKDPLKLNILVHGRSRHETILQIARKIWGITAQYDIVLTPTTHIPSCHAKNLQVAPPIVQFV
jgi:Asp-tRNA(Asn)/Glu-tRNA(Gln) amidotransferase A subunit family amidase